MQITRDWRKWNPHSYLKQYYETPTIASDERSILRYLLPFLKKQPKPFTRAIEVGCGPTLHHAVALIPFVEELHMADYVQANLKHIQYWLENSPNAHNWDTYIREIIALEHTKETVQDRKKALRQKITTLTKIDLKKKYPLASGATYPLVASFYCADSIAQTKREWQTYMRHLFHVVAPGGTLILSALHRATGYQVGKHAFPSANITANDMREIFIQHQFSHNRLDIHEAPVPEWNEEGFDSILIAIAQK